MAEDVAKLQRQREQALAAGDQESVDIIDRRIAAAEPGIWDVAKDLPASAMSGIIRGVTEDIPSTPADIYDLGRSANVLQHKLQGASPEELQAMRDANAQANPLQGFRDIVPSSLKTPYKPTTPAGEWVEDAARFVAGGAPKKIIRDVIMPYIGGKVGGVAGGKLGPEEAQLLSVVGGTGGSAGTEGTARATIRPGDPAVRNQINTLRDPGPDPHNPLTAVELTGGQAIDSPTLKYFEAGPFGNRAAGIGEQQLRQFTQRALELAGIRGTDRADFATMERAQAELSQQYENLIRANNGIDMADPKLQQSLIDAGLAYERVKGSDPNSPVVKYYNRIADASQQHGGVIPPDVFQVIHSEMSADLKSMRNSPELAQESLALRAMEEAMFTSLENSAGVGNQTRALNRQYRNFKILEDAMYSTSTDAARGFITPAALAQAVKRSESKAGFTQGRSDFADMSNAGSSLMKDIGNTASGGRAMVGAVGGGLASGAGLLMAGQPLAAAGAASAAVGAPLVSAGISNRLTARPVRTSIVNRATGINSEWLNPMQLAPIVNQAVQSPTLPYPGMPTEPPVVVEPEEPEKQTMNFEAPAPVERSGDLPQLVLDMMRRRGLA